MFSLPGLMGNLSFVIQLLIAEFLFLFKFEKRDKFRLRYIGAIGAIFVFRIGCYLLQSPIVSALSASLGEVAFNLYMATQNIVVIIVSIFAMRLAYKGNFLMTLSACATAEAAQHISYKLTRMIGSVVDFGLFSYLMEFVMLAVVLVVVYFLFVRNVDGRDYENSCDLRFGVLSFAVVAVCIGVNRLAGNNATGGTLYALDIYAVSFCVLVLVVQYIQFDRNRSYLQSVVNQNLLKEQAKQYEQWKASVEQININYHDLKHELNALKEQSAGGNFEALEKIVNDYGSLVRTGNEMLDVLLTGKKSVCLKNGIAFSCMIDGEALKGLDDMLLYSIFCNALDNAVESSLKADDPQKRIIALNVKRFGGTVIVQIENYFEGEVVFEDGLPMYIGKDYSHGYGMKSMLAMAEKMKGTMSVRVEDNSFKLGFIFPLQK